jgi:hypothetical protein
MKDLNKLKQVFEVFQECPIFYSLFVKIISFSVEKMTLHVFFERKKYEISNIM